MPRTPLAVSLKNQTAEYPKSGPLPILVKRKNDEKVLLDCTHHTERILKKFAASY